MVPTPADRPPSRIPLGLLREILALLLLAAGTAAVLYVAWDYTINAGLAVTGVMAIVLGFSLAGDR